MKMELGKTFRYVLPLDKGDYSSVLKVGGKNASLGELTKAGFSVPPGVCVTSDAYALFLRENNLWEKIDKLLPLEISKAEEASSEIRELIESSKIPEETEEEIGEAYEIMDKQLRGLGVKEPRFAVRSSGTAEDMPTASFAGQFDSFLWVKGSENILENVRKCWSSLFTSRGIEYRNKMGISHQASSMSAGIQLMVDAKSAGVMFTLNPVNGDRSIVEIGANWGLADSVVKGITLVDTFRVDKVTFGITTRLVQTKTLQCVLDREKGEGVDEEIPAELQNTPCLNDEEIIELTRQAKAIEKYYKSPQDIEFAISKDLEFPKNISFVQSRPETKWSQRKEPLTKSKGHIAEHLVDWFTGKGI